VKVFPERIQARLIEKSAGSKPSTETTRAQVATNWEAVAA
jgi:hypothetical protein